MNKNIKKTIIYTLLLAAPQLFGQPLAEKLPELHRPVLPAPPVYSGDGAVIVFSSQKHKNYRGPILIFVNRTRQLFQTGLNLKFGSAKCPLEVRIGEKSDGDTSVLTARIRDVNGNLREKIELPDPEAADLNRFRRAIAVAFLRIWMVNDGGTDQTMKDLPGWLINGMLRYLQGVHRQTDLDRVYQLWSNACLPPADALYGFESYAARREPAVASVLAGWFLEKRGHAFKILLKNAAHGAEWNVEKAAAILAQDFAGDFDRILDMRFYALGKRVIKPGVTTPGILCRFRSELLLFPSDYGMMLPHTDFYCSFREAIDLSDRKEIRQAALDRALKIRAAAAGRDGALLALSESYAGFLRALASGKKSRSELLSLLSQAEAQRVDLENSLAAGNKRSSRPVVK